VTSDLIHRRRWAILAVLILSLVTISLDNTILNVALPSLGRDLDASSSTLQWIVDGYMLVFASLLLTVGAMGDRFGRKRVLTFGLVLFGGGSLLAAIATSGPELIAFRALMGLGGACIMPSTLSILTVVFDADERPKAIAAWAAVAGLGVAIGPVLGGWLIEVASWHWVFLVNVPIVVLALVLGHRLIPESRDPAPARIDLGGAALSTAGMTALLWAIIEAPTRGWTDGAILGAFALAAAILSAFAVWELRSPAPMLELALFRNRRFSAASAAIGMTFAALFGSMFMVTQYLQSVHGFSALKAGAWGTPIAIGMLLGAPLSTKLTARLGERVIVAAGMTVVGGALSLFATADAASGFWLIGGADAMLGFGMGLAMAPATDLIMGALPADRASVGSALNDTVRELGGALGVAILGSILTSNYRQGMDAVTGAPDAAHDSIGAATVAAQHVGGTAGRALQHTANGAFLDGMHAAIVVAVAVTIGAALLALALLPSRAKDRGSVPSGVAVQGAAA
jgi:EmrB/QacA subfamily drug resistance transporter